MKQRKYIMITLAIVMAAVIALSVNSALAAGSGSTPLDDDHAPACYQVESFVPGPFELHCTDAGKDIFDVKVITSDKFELTWDNETVSLRVYTDEKKPPTHREYWVVTDKAGSTVFGQLP